MPATNPTLFTDFLQELGVPHTVDYSNQRFWNMPFKSLFGLSKLLEEYGIPNEGLQLADKRELRKLSAPFLARTPRGFVIVTSLGDNSVEYLTQGVSETVPYHVFEDAWTGMVFLAYPGKESREPGYAAHARTELISKLKVWILWGCLAALFLYLFISNKVYSHLSTVLITLLDLAGLGFTYLLLQKSLKIHSHAADRVCGIIQEGGCDNVLDTKASSFFGIFSWSEVGFTYFSVSLLALLIFPEQIRYLAAINICCLPYSFWSVWYQKFRAKSWCTLCLSVQATLWLLFACYLTGGWIHNIFPLRMPFFVMGVCYITVLLALNYLMPKFDRNPKPGSPDHTE